MSVKTRERKKALQARLTDLAERQIATGGMSSLRARDLAREAGCSVGAIYNVFNDLNALVMAVNGRTFRRLGAQVGAAIEALDSATPHERLITMSRSYLAFAAEHTLLWRALFDLEMTADGDVPAWYLDELAVLFGLIAGPLSEIYPDKSAEDRALMVRALFSSIHGIVLLGLERRISGVPFEKIEEMIAVVLSEIGS